MYVEYTFYLLFFHPMYTLSILYFTRQKNALIKDQVEDSITVS